MKQILESLKQELVKLVLEYNPYHDKLGRFTFKNKTGVGNAMPTLRNKAGVPSWAIRAALKLGREYEKEVSKEKKKAAPPKPKAAPVSTGKVGKAYFMGYDKATYMQMQKMFEHTNHTGNEAGFGTSQDGLITTIMKGSYGSVEINPEYIAWTFQGKASANFHTHPNAGEGFSKKDLSNFVRFLGHADTKNIEMSYCVVTRGSGHVFKITKPAGRAIAGHSSSALSEYEWATQSNHSKWSDYKFWLKNLKDFADKLHLEVSVGRMKKT